MYACAILLRETVGEDDDVDLVRPFTSLTWAFFTTFRCIMGDCSPDSGQPLPVLMTRRFGWTFAVGFFLLLMVTSFGLFNVIAAIYLEKILHYAKRKDQRLRQERLGDQRRLTALMAEL